MSKKHGQTGPKTEEGKARSSLNALRHGLCSSKIVLKGEDQASYEALLQDLIDEYKPATTTEALLVDQLAQNYWRLQRARLREQENDKYATRTLLLLNRYANSYHRAFHKTLETLCRMQKDRARREAESFRSVKSAPHPAPPPAEPRKSPAETPEIVEFPTMLQRPDSLTCPDRAG